MSFIDRTLQDIADFFPDTNMTKEELEAYNARNSERAMHPTHFQEFWPIYVFAVPLGAVILLGIITDFVITVYGQG